MTTTRYRGYDIVARPYRLAESGRWTVDFDIRCRGKGRSFSLKETHATVEEADAQCVVLGRRIIEDRVEGWSVQDLRASFDPLEPLVRFMTAESLTPLIVGVAAVLCFGGLAMLRAVR